MIPAKYEEVKVQMDSLLYTVEYDSELFSPSIAYTIQTKKNGNSCKHIQGLFYKMTPLAVSGHLTMDFLWARPGTNTSTWFCLT